MGFQPGLAVGFAILVLQIGSIPAAEAQGFRLPLDCSGASCAIQNYADIDVSTGAKDPGCGSRTYDGHDGLDFRVPGAAARAGVEVLAPSSGVIRSIRDGETDGAYVSGGRASVADRECGNGVVIDHGGGWSSQLCHMRRNSVRVKPGERVEAGQIIGLVGLSGFSEFPHVHMTLRKDGNVVEPLRGNLLKAATCQAGSFDAGPHWSPSAAAALRGTGTQWFELGFVGSEPKRDPSLLDLKPGRQTPLIFWALAVSPRTGDIMRVTLFRPDGTVLAQGERRQARDQAQAWIYTGRPAPADGWPAGLYRAEATLIREGRAIEVRQTQIDLVS